MKNLTLAATILLASCAWAAEPATTQPAKGLTLDLGNGVSVKLVLIPAGKFLMGSPETEKGRAKDEVQHEVTISKPFYMGATHVTVDQFGAFVRDTAYRTDAEKSGSSQKIEAKDGKLMFPAAKDCSWRSPGFPQAGDHPVVQVSWNDATAFCDWLSKRAGKTVVLPTEAQWEYCCRAGTATAYPWGDAADDGKGWANCADQSLKEGLPNAPNSWPFFGWKDGFMFTSPVASFKANRFGLYDMIGNADEWCADVYADYEEGPATDPTGPRYGGLRVLRGGSWFSAPAISRAAHRFGYSPERSSSAYGFRVAVIP